MKRPLILLLSILLVASCKKPTAAVSSGPQPAAVASPQPSSGVDQIRAAAEKGDPKAQDQLGEMYAFGKDVPKDYPTALQWFLKAANQGEPRACVWVGVACEQGIAGMPKDTQKAIEWYKKAGDEPKAKEMLARLGVK